MRALIMLVLLQVSMSAYSWDGYDYDKGSYIEIDKGNTVRRGNEIEYYDYNDGQYKSGDVESVRSRGSKVEVEVLDSESGEIRTFEMEE